MSKVKYVKHNNEAYKNMTNDYLNNVPILKDNDMLFVDFMEYIRQSTKRKVVDFFSFVYTKLWNSSSNDNRELIGRFAVDAVAGQNINDVIDDIGELFATMFIDSMTSGEGVEDEEY